MSFLQERSASDDAAGRRRAVTALLRLFAVLLVGTLVARGAAAATMPTVTAARPGQGRVSHSVLAAGSIASDPGVPFTLPEGLLVETVPVRVGQTVSPGAVLATFNARAVEEAIAQTAASVKKLQVQAAQQAAGETPDDFAVGQAQAALARAYEKFHQTDDSGRRTVADAEAARQSARQALDALKSSPPPADAATPEQSDAGDAYESWQQEVQAAETALAEAEAALKAAQNGAETALDTANDAAQSAEDARNSALHDYETAQKDAARQNALSGAEADVTRAELARLAHELDALRQLQTDGCALLCADGGTLTSLALAPGGQSPAVGGLLAPADAGYTLTAQLEEDDAQWVAVGDSITVTQGKLSEKAAVTALSAPDADGAVTLTAALPAAAWKAGAASLSTSAAGGEGMTLPAGAVNTDANGSFVYTVEERSTVLGLQNVLVRTPVTVTERGDSAVLVTGGLSAQSRVVTASSKPLSDGARVRLDG